MNTSFRLKILDLKRTLWIIIDQFNVQLFILQKLIEIEEFLSLSL